MSKKISRYVYVLLGLLLAGLLTIGWLWLGRPIQSSSPSYPEHKVTATMFYIGEPANNSNGYISNRESAWDDEWIFHFGGIDTPDKREGWFPAGVMPRENAFYVALPYNDLDSQGRRKSSANKIYWYNSSLPADVSVVKNRWIKICHSQICAYGQWEDAGPFGEDDTNYVFGTAQPQNTQGAHAGIDLSPALDDYLHVGGQATVTWQFVDRAQVPQGPWLTTITDTNTHSRE